MKHAEQGVGIFVRGEVTITVDRCPSDIVYKREGGHLCHHCKFATIVGAGTEHQGMWEHYVQGCSKMPKYPEYEMIVDPVSDGPWEDFTFSVIAGCTHYEEGEFVDNDPDHITPPDSPPLSPLEDNIPF